MNRTALLLSAVLLLLASLAISQERPEGVEPDGRMVVLYALPRHSDELETTVLEVESVTCDEGVTTVDLGDSGVFSVGPSTRSTDSAFDIYIDFERFDILGGYRDIAWADSVELEWDESSMSGRYGFTLFGDHAGNYGLEFDIDCE